MSPSAALAVALAALAASSALAVVYSQHLSREAYAELGAHRRTLDALDAQWSRLQIEQSTFAGHGRIERAARESLDMRLPRPDDSVLIAREHR